MAINRHSLEQVQFVSVEGGAVQVRVYQPHADKALMRTPLLVTHGGPGGSSIGLYDALNQLADQRPVIFYDQLGSFSSPAEISLKQMTLERFASEPLQILDQLHLKRVHLLGHSWGGSVMTQFCLSHPERVSKLILSSPLLSTQQWIEDCNHLLKEIKSDLRVDADIKGEFEKRHFCLNKEATDFICSESRRTNTRLYECMWGSSEFIHSGVLATLNFFPRLHQIAASTLLICGDNDTATPSTLQNAKDRIGLNAQLQVLSNAGHKTYIDCNQQFIEIISTFLDDKSNTTA